MVRKIPASVRSKGQQIVDQKDSITIESINPRSKSVIAKVIAASPYTVELSEIDPSYDDCSCDLFNRFGYCEHIAAVEIFFRTLKLPLNQLFDVSEYSADTELDFALLSKEIRAIVALYPPAIKLLSANYSSSQHKGSSVFQLAKPASSSDGEQFYQQLGFFELESFFYESEKVAASFELVIQSAPYQSWENSESNLYISMKIGKAAEKKRYLVKNFQNLFIAIEQRQTYRVTPKISLNLGWDSFDSITQEVLRTLLNFNTYSSLASHSNVQNNLERYILVPPANVGAVLKLLLKQGHYNFSESSAFDFRKTDQHRLTYEHLSTKNSPIKMVLTENPESFSLSIENEVTETLLASNILISGHHFFQLSEAQSFSYRQLKKGLDQLKKNKSEKRYQLNVEFPIDNSIVIEFYKDERAELLAIFENFKALCQLTLPASLTMADFKPYFEISRANQRLIIDFAFIYDEQRFQSYQSLEKVKFLRQLKAENFVIKVLHQLDYEITGFQGFKSYPKNQALLDFFQKEIPKLRQLGQVILSDELEAAFSSISNFKHDILIKQSDGLFSVNFEIDGIDESEIDSLLYQLEAQEKYFETQDGRIISLDDDEMNRVASVLKSLRQKAKLKNGSFELARHQTVLAQALLNEFDAVRFDRQIAEMAYDLTHPESFKMELSPQLNAELRPYQIKGIQFLSMLDYYHFGGILADEMGLGKTLQTIAFLMTRVSLDQPTVIVCPASLVYNWLEEFKRFAPGVEVLVVEGSKDERFLAISDTAEVYITSYQSMRLDIESYHLKTINYLILDEAQFVKNSQTKINQSLRALKPNNVFALSGTPIENRLDELWSIMSIVMPGLFPSKREFNKLSALTVSQMVSPFILRREKAKVLAELPEKIEKNLYSELSEAQKVVYLAQLKQMQIKVEGMTSATFVKNKLEILTGLTRLRQICDSPKLYLDDFSGESGKIEQLKELLLRIKANGSRPLIFSQFTTMLDLVESELKQLNISSFKLNGSVPSKQRLEMVDAFNAGARDVFLISLKAGGTGLNLTGADTVILLDLWWNPAVEDQATARAHRFGQKNNVEVLRLITRGTIEEEIYRLQAQKRDLIDQVLSGTAEKSTLTEAEIREILGIS
ncbi:MULTISPECIES: DEAD/DEAH box helicase [unclassified Enterococcus]|uniref:DEAD/DEAH box helicase n=1 Tax=unclassified Enterococcus TaxID=2608891 RepID=UPI001553DFBA|nr:MULTISPECIES: DEAD/DEAH box helicase [unclassified Enterococcus]MBS7577350.1 DEAD/DEAH box helicase [Enterococcus sp. MMGLQ5-2]MBS7584757.1 DEAD/DEAH box helicase [Enterococcus sp. MMGLQ5-1]NPD12612.1 DEAD/DEAH box helicase [Enterococcus sp. MMGLQ5-1]NPD37184.1 DEAD/DEAH box helicase [Enterococcus sp. MMGLQ5-2]